MKLFDKNKKGTLIVSYYRSGTHFLSSLINEKVDFAKSGFVGELVADIDFRVIHSKIANVYQIAILNATDPKFDLVAHPWMIADWHVIKLTRTNKVNHFISWYFWMKNFEQNETFKFKHNSASSSDYLNYMSSQTEKIYYDINKIKSWISEQLITYFVKCDEVIDYDELKYLTSENCVTKWSPNDYANITLYDIFSNAEEIEKLLANFKLPQI
jgi:hypothetical protein